MYVCSCRAVTDSTVRNAIASGATSVEDIVLRCSAGSRCRGCWPTLARLLHDAAGDRPACDGHAA